MAEKSVVTHMLAIKPFFKSSYTTSIQMVSFCVAVSHLYIKLVFLHLDSRKLLIPMKTAKTFV